MTEPTDKRLPDEQQLDEYLKGDSSVSRQYRQLPGEGVPASLDRLVLRQAEDAVKRPSRPAWMRWTAPLAVAASAVLVVSIVLETGMKDETLVTAPAAQLPMETRMSEESAAVPPPAQVAAPPPAAAPVAPAFAPENRKLARPPVAKEAGDTVLQEQVAKAAAQRDNNAQISDAQLANAERQKAELEATARARELSATQRVARGEENEVAGPRDTVETPEPKAVLSYSRPISAIPGSTATIQRNYADPEAWLEDIRQLRKDHKQEEADREWRRFLATFPDYEVAETDAAREAKK
ncbi:hypothetical protein [Steroidobacter cummioxidans]|uniref:hypothetical protein n=1 Tax=Steroidobacter cummioxidans TaxID=1803913 RepID=UPI000E3170CC|nr:hypothetical protein [Steroidobacter cummioxidans]